MGILAVHITTAKIRAFQVNQASLGYLGHPGQIGGWWVPQNDVTMEAVRADDYFPLAPVGPSGYCKKASLGVCATKVKKLAGAAALRA